jgi:hypothetical protein
VSLRAQGGPAAALLSMAGNAGRTHAFHIPP